MKFDDLKQDWQQTVEDSESPENLTEIINMLAKQTTKIDNEIKRRDFLEIGIAILLIPAWIYGLTISAGLMQTTGLIIALITSVLIPYKMLKAKKVTPLVADNHKSFLQTERQKLKQQKQLLEQVVWWYIAPITTSIVLITLGATVDPNGIPSVNDQLLTYYGFVSLLVVGIYFLNKRAAKKKFDPLLTQIEQQLADIERS